MNTGHLTARQMGVLHIVASQPKTIDDIVRDGFGFTYSQTAGIIARLVARRLVEPVGWRSRSRLYDLTDEGRWTEIDDFNSWLDGRGSDEH